ncbi:uncharacterized protein LOC125194901 [Salvia hispanica]|uniref:uncharacterized protein LOC125194901 n=1 Tax=Salvia hispanica TaxID=49212 RepID=UPI0020099D1E|nr:uncharacterized protein LOC125194901 [Salvia hispanica]
MPYSVDEQDATDGRYGWTPEQGSRGIGGSQTPEDNPNAPPPLPNSVPTHSRGGDIHIRTAYTPPEMEKMFKAYLEISEDPEIGTNQTRERFWWRVSRRYNANRPEGTIERNESMVCNAIFRANEEIQKFQGYYLQEQRSAGSGMSEADIITATMSTYHCMHYKPFKHLIAWQQVYKNPKYRGGLSSSSSSSSKRRGRYPCPTATPMRWLASLPELTWVAPTPSEQFPTPAARKEESDSGCDSIRPCSRSHSLCATSTPHQLVVDLFGSTQFGR